MVLDYRGFKVVDYMGGYAVKERQEDRYTGKVTPEGTNKEKIGGLLQGFIKVEKEWNYGSNYNFSIVFCYT